MDLGLKGKTAIVTGGASNIGKAIAEGLSAEGANVVIADMDTDQGIRVADQLQASGAGEALFAETNVADKAQVENLVNETLESFGQIDILVNNAGWTRNALFLEKPLAE